MSNWVGQVVSFKYNKGSNPGGQRLVRVLGCDASNLEGIDLNLKDGDGYRHFKQLEIDGGLVTVVAEPHEDVVNLKNLVNVPTDNLTEADILTVAKVLLPGRVINRYRKDLGLLVLLQTNLPRLEVSISSTNTKFRFLSETGTSALLEFEHEPTGVKAYTLTHKFDSQTLTDLISKLSALVPNKQVKTDDITVKVPGYPPAPIVSNTIRTPNWGVDGLSKEDLNFLMKK